jgi:hypothetical protein
MGLLLLGLRPNVAPVAGIILPLSGKKSMGRARIRPKRSGFEQNWAFKDYSFLLEPGKGLIFAPCISPF